MISLIDKRDISNGDAFISQLPLDRPHARKSIRKVVFFLFREGVAQTLSKVLSKFFKEKLDENALCIKIGKKNGVSYDGGKSYFISDKDMDQEIWRNPFSYDVMGSLNKLNFPSVKREPLALFLVGCGDYARTYSMSVFKQNRKLAAVDYNSSILEKMKDKFDYVALDLTQVSDVWVDSDKPVALVASYHSDHARQADFLYSLNPEAYIFIEKPPAVNLADILIINRLYQQGAKIEVGFNRRYAPISQMAKDHLGDGAKMISITVNEVGITEGHWYQWPNQGSRITGNACHWIDLCQWFVDAEPETLTLNCSTKNIDDCTLSISYVDGSLVNIFLTDKGNDLRGVQELIEIKESNKTVRIEDFTRLVVMRKDGRRSLKHFVRRDKGHAKMYQRFKENVEASEFRTQYPLKDFNRVSRTVLFFSQMIEEKQNYREFKVMVD